MAKPTAYLRYQWREIDDGKGLLKVPMLQQWFEAEGREP